MAASSPEKSHVFVVVGVGFGDEGKGSIVDYLCRKENASLVVRFNGGPQAAHHIVLPDGQWYRAYLVSFFNCVFVLKALLQSIWLRQPCCWCGDSSFQIHACIASDVAA